MGYLDMLMTPQPVSGTDIPILVTKCEEEARKIIDYMSINRLKANDEKTHVMVIRKVRSEKRLIFNIGKEVIKESESEKPLGVYVENDLKWDIHLAKLLSKLRPRLFRLRRIKEKNSKTPPQKGG